MAGFIDKALDIWNELEETYRKRGKGLGRKEFLLKLCGNVEGKHRLDVLKSSVMAEYDKNPHGADLLTKVFDSLAQNWDKVLEAEDIEDLTTFVGTLATQQKTTSMVDIDTFLEGIKPFGKKEESYSTFDELFLETGFLSDTYRLVDGKEKMFRVPNYVPGKQLFLFKAGQSEKVFVDRLRQEDEFIKLIQPALMSLMKDPEIDINSYFLVVGKDNFTKRLGSVTITLEKEKFQAEITQTVVYGDRRVLYCSYKNGYFDFPILCIS